MCDDDGKAKMGQTVLFSVFSLSRTSKPQKYLEKLFFSFLFFIFLLLKFNLYFIYFSIN